MCPGNSYSDLIETSDQLYIFIWEPIVKRKRRFENELLYNSLKHVGDYIMFTSNPKRKRK